MYNRGRGGGRGRGGDGGFGAQSYQGSYQQQQSASDTLLVTVSELRHPITDDIMHRIFDGVAQVSRVHVFPQTSATEMSAAIQFTSADGAKNALEARNGRNIYADCNKMNMSFNRWEGLVPSIPAATVLPSGGVLSVPQQQQQFVPQQQQQAPQQGQYIMQQPQQQAYAPQSYPQQSLNDMGQHPTLFMQPQQPPPVVVYNSAPISQIPQPQGFVPHAIQAIPSQPQGWPNMMLAPQAGVVRVGASQPNLGIAMPFDPTARGGRGGRGGGVGRGMGAGPNMNQSAMMNQMMMGFGMPYPPSMPPAQAVPEVSQTVYLSCAFVPLDVPLQTVFTLLESYGSVVSVRRNQGNPEIVVVKMSSAVDVDNVVQRVRGVPLGSKIMNVKKFAKYTERYPCSEEGDPSDPTVLQFDFTTSRHRSTHHRSKSAPSRRLKITLCPHTEAEVMEYLCGLDFFPESVSKEADATFLVVMDTVENGIRLLITCQNRVCGEERSNVIFMDDDTPPAAAPQRTPAAGIDESAAN